MSASLPLPAAKSASQWPNSIAVAGLLLFAAGAIVLMGIITAESLYDATYTTHDNEISDLGATVPPDSVSYQPSSTIFNATMLTSGAAIIAATAMLRRNGQGKRLLVPLLLLGIGAFGVGVFPGNRAPMHGLFALLTFSAGGVTGILAAKSFAQPFRACSMALGIVALAALAAGLFATGTVIEDEIGLGGIERWIAYPVVLWLVVSGGYLMSGRLELPAAGKARAGVDD